MKPNNTAHFYNFEDALFRVSEWNLFMNLILWIKNRLLERTTWDGGVCIALGLLVLFMAPLAKILAGVAIAYGAWTIWKGEYK